MFKLSNKVGWALHLKCAKNPKVMNKDGISRKKWKYRLKDDRYKHIFPQQIMICAQRCWWAINQFMNINLCFDITHVYSSL